MADDLMVDWGKLKLTMEEEEAEEYVEEIPEARMEEIALSLLGKFLTPNTISTKAMKAVRQSVWRPSKGMVVKEPDKNLFIFQFFSGKDKDFSLNEGPWAFDGHLLILKEWRGTEQLSEITFDKSRFWPKTFRQFVRQVLLPNSWVIRYFLKLRRKLIARGGESSMFQR
ncbi:LOW QUALITY PROTEIN: hypothetical protein Cgig2_019106 [Carnegiea gigantea]|uniref:DUF4283 domain-containing protein n=1 Tax=Carnegiea gigantea TaxID=171969 RepID=A0A9Q1QH81_9CARY|nr:LOW QUALITY PROTEIN: hypothetical protein Cgig2_019106 [Carnegiea gigantea]